MDELLYILAHGDDAQVAAHIYHTEPLGDSSRQIPLSLLRALRAQQPNERLEIVERHVSGQFELVILRLPWQQKSAEPGSGYHPLLITAEGGLLQVVGFVMPWNEVMPQLGAKMGSILPLSLVWISRITALKSGASE